MSETAVTGAISETRQEILKVEWKVKDFLSLKGKAGTYWRSPKFRFLDNSCFLVVFPNGREGTEDFVALVLFFDGPYPSNLLTLGMKKTDGTLVSATAVIRKFQVKCGYGLCKMISRSKLQQKKDEFMVEGAITFTCALNHACPIEAMDTLSLDFKKLLVSSAQSDLTVRLKSKTTEIPYEAHRAVLAARSDVFACALEHEMIEKKSGVITIEDCDPDSFKEFLQYLYTNRANITEGNVFHLFMTADKYLVKELKLYCIAFLIENLSVDNLCDVIALADLYNDANLIRTCKEFFSKKAGSIFMTSKWKSLMISNNKIAGELLEHIAPKQADED